ncbi:FAD dependent oxidoreductase [Sporobacter termitidis DSM 10068]|uniref:FAD dependent oxidoreductase n=1 Tax=Sporobacter termitidis DSM 10068 TaxID=1123282 RepID=A0A1M5YN57_9FIRM|nr:FAD-dependent oxidoreductase [Sporobacter termitidis]SHI13380.1 FAD dependent oxidoreductase [Sporobacter termitidis DSM 10068]
MTNTSGFFTDVLVVGGGVAGAAAAITAARKGARTMIVDSAQSMGGLATNGYVTGIAGVNEGICKEWLDRLAADGDAVIRPHLPVIDPDKGKLMLERMMVESGCRILYGTTALDAVLEDGVVRGAVCHGKSGKFEIAAKLVIDGTGDGDVAVSAGAPFELGSPHDAGLNMSTTLAFRMANVDLQAYYEANFKWRESAGRDRLTKSFGLLQDLEEQAVSNGDLPFVVFPTALIYQVPKTEITDADITVMTTHSFYTRNTDTEDLTRQILEQHNQMVWLERFFKKYVPGFTRARVTGIANMHGVRDSRRILGEYILKDTDVAAGARFEDGIARFPEFFDTHHPTSRRLGFLRHIHVTAPLPGAVCREAQCSEEMHPFGRPAGLEARVDPKGYSEIPYRSLVPLKAENLLVVGRCVSAEFNAQAAVRIIAPSMGTGQAAGIAAALCLKTGLTPRQLDGRRVRQAMIDDGVPLDRPFTGHWGAVQNFEGEHVVLTGDFIGFRQQDGSIVTAM